MLAYRSYYLGKAATSWHPRCSPETPTCTPGAWAGAVFETSPNSVSVSISQDKWDKAKGILLELQQQILLSNNQTVNFKSLEIARVFLCHISMTFEFITHHLKGFHLSLASYLDKRDGEGWRLNNKEWICYLQHRVNKNELSFDEMQKLLYQDQDQPPEPPGSNNKPQPKKYVYDPPERIQVGTHLLNDLEALVSFFESPSPPALEVRKQNVCCLLYGFADASGTGLGSTVLIPGTGIRYRVGVWGSDEANSSNF
jgi:hypothetical protein